MLLVELNALDAKAPFLASDISMWNLQATCFRTGFWFSTLSGSDCSGCSNCSDCLVLLLSVAQVWLAIPMARIADIAE
jgi:hypothetical protein